MLVKKVEVQIRSGFMQNSYLLTTDSKSDIVIVVDPGANPDKIIKAIGKRKLEAIILTHGHYDHIGAALALKEKYDCVLMASAGDNTWLKDRKNTTLTKEDHNTQDLMIDRFLESGDSIAFDGNEKALEVIATPGHTHGSICLYDAAEKQLISGDTLFFEAFGRTDFPGGSFNEMRTSLKKLAKLPEETKVYPGHDKSTTIGHELKRGVLQDLV